MKKTQALRAINEISGKAADQLLGQLKFKYLIPESLKARRTEQEINILLSELGDPGEFSEQLKDHWRQEIEFIDDVPKTLYPMIMVYSITIFEAFLTDIAKVLFTYFWKSLRSRDRTMTYEEILHFEDIHSLREKLIETDLMRFAFGSIRDRITHLEKKPGLKFSYERAKGIRKNWNCIELATLVEIHAARNLVVHNAGIVNPIYLSEIKNSPYRPGDPLKLDKDYVLDALTTLFRVTRSITAAAVDKIKSSA